MVAHNDGQRLNNHVSNLRWATHAENCADTALHGSLKGTKNPRCKITAEQVLAARQLKNNGIKIASIARKYGLSWSAMHSAIVGKNWSHVHG
jgi:hypothetical protein